MDVIKAIHDHSPCCSYCADPVSSERLMELVDAGRRARSEREEHQEFVVITDVSTLRQLSTLVENHTYIAKAAAAIAIFCRADDTTAVMGGAMAAENILLAASSVGLGACWVAAAGHFQIEALASLLRMPEHLQFVGLISLGVPDGEKEANPPLPPLEEILHWQHF